MAILQKRHQVEVKKLKKKREFSIIILFQSQEMKNPYQNDINDYSNRVLDLKKMFSVFTRN